MKTLKIGKNDAGQRLDRFVSKAVPLLPESLLQKYIRLKRIKLNGKGSKRDVRISEGDVLELYINDEFFEKPTEDNAYLRISTPRLDIVYEDENIILCDKKAGVLCHSAGEWDVNTLISNIKAYLYQKGEWKPREEHSFAPALANRIDRNTQGIVIAAKTAEALRILDEKIRAREIDKRYLAAIHGVMEPKNGTLTGYIFKDAKNNRVYVSECELLTGRTHQIRAQFSHAGHPLVGDGKYGRDRDGEGQQLCSYKLVFSFKTDAGALNYLLNKEFTVETPNFASFFGFSI